MQLQITAHRDQAKARLIAAYDGLVIDAPVAEIEITWVIPPSQVGEAALQHAGQLSPRVGLLQHFRTGCRPQQKRTGPAAPNREFATLLLSYGPRLGLQPRLAPPFKELLVGAGGKEMVTFSV